MNRKRFWVAALLFLIAVGLSRPQEAVQTSEWAERLKDLGAFIENMLAEWKVPGAAVAVVAGDRVVFAGGYGLRDTEHKLPVTADTLFAIGSCTKAFTATTLAILADEGRLDWDRPVRSYLPEFRLADPLASERMTARDLLCHRSGLPRHDTVWYSSRFSREELLERLRHLEPSRDFRQSYQYQNLMFMTAGYLAGRLAGMSWESFTRERILKPLGMTRTNFSVNDMQRTLDHALPYANRKGEIVRIPFHNLDPIAPAGSINSSVNDMARWIRLNLNRGAFGDRRLVSEAIFSQLHMPQMVNSQPLRYDELLYASYGLGWGINAYRGRLMVSHGGSIDGFQAQVSLLPREGLGLVVLTNLAENPLPTIITYALWDRLLGFEPADWSGRIKEERAKAEEEREKKKAEEAKNRRLDTQPSHPLDDYAGTFAHPGYGQIVVEKSGQGLKSRLNDIPFTLTHYHYDIFRLENEERSGEYFISFQTGFRGEIESLAVPLEPSAKPIVFLRVSEEKTK